MGLRHGTRYRASVTLVDAPCAVPGCAAVVTETVGSATAPTLGVAIPDGRLVMGYGF